MKGNNSSTREAFIKELGHPRKIELANMIFDGASVEEMKNAGYGRINILEMAREISRDVEGQENLSIDIPRDDAEPESEKKESASDATSDNANQESASSTPKNENDGDAKASEDGKVDTLGGNPVGTTTGQEDAEKIAENVADEANADAYGKGGAHDTETIGGNPQTSTTGQEDSEKLNENAQ